MYYVNALVSVLPLSIKYFGGNIFHLKVRINEAAVIVMIKHSVSAYKFALSSPTAQNVVPYLHTTVLFAHFV